MKRKVKRSEGAEEITFNEAATIFLQEKEALNLAPTSIRNYRLNLDMFTNYFEFDDTTLCKDIELSMIYQYTNHLRAQGIAASTIRGYIRALRVFFYWCMEDNRKYIDKPFKIKLPKAQEEPLKFFTDEEIEILLEKPKRNASFVEWRNWAVTAWILATGNRAATVVDVKIDDIDYKRREIILHHTKNKKAQIIPLSSTLEIVLKEYIRMWRKDAPEGAYLFPNVGEEKIRADSLGHAFRLYCMDRGLKKTSIHGLRHTFARMWIKNNGNVFRLQKILGHSTLDMTKRYVKLFGEDLKEEYDSYSPLDVVNRKNKRKKLVK